MLTIICPHCLRPITLTADVNLTISTQETLTDIWKNEPCYAAGYAKGEHNYAMFTGPVKNLDELLRHSVDSSEGEEVFIFHFTPNAAPHRIKKWNREMLEWDDFEE
jgi:hypothetical protein